MSAANDASLIEHAYALACAAFPKPVAPDACDLCTPERRCLVHREPQDWPHPTTTKEPTR